MPFIRLRKFYFEFKIFKNQKWMLDFIKYVFCIFDNVMWLFKSLLMWIKLNVKLTLYSWNTLPVMMLIIFINFWSLKIEKFLCSYVYEEFSLWFSFLGMSLSSFGIKVMLAVENELGNITSCSVFWKFV